jgi:replicative DNA helicase
VKNFEAINIEQSILGSLIVDDSLGYKLDELNDDMFTVSYNKYILNTMKYLHKEKMSLDIQTISAKIGEDTGINVSYLSNLAAMSQCLSIDTHIGILKDKYLRREIIKNCTSLFQALGEDGEINSIIYNFDNRMQKILNEGYVENDDSVTSICERILDFLGNNEEIGIRFGVKFLDDIIGGLFKGELTTIAARSGVGKTALALQIMLNCMEQKKKVLFISREMSNEQVFMRNITKRTGVSTKSMKNKDLDEESWQSILRVMADFNSSNLIYINDRISTISAVRKRIRTLKSDLVIVDFDEAVKDINKSKESILGAKKKGIKLVDLIVAKCRDGETGFRHYCYNGPRLHFQYINY